MRNGMVNTFFKVLNTKAFIAFTVGLMLVILFSQADHRFGYTSSEEKEYTPILSDGNGYYAYLPQYIVYPDSAKFGFYDDVDKRYPDKSFFEMMGRDDETKTASNKFYIGTALLQAPFYYIAHQLHLIKGWNADGYALGYRFSIQIAALFYWLIGVIALFSLFTRLGFSRFSILVGVVTITFGTNLNMYTSFWASLSHVYSFSMVACFLNIAHKWVTENKSKDLVLAFFILGLIAIIRPVNILVILILPFFFSSFSLFSARVKTLFLQKYLGLILGLICAAIPVLILLLVQYDQTGKISIYSYGEEGFSNALTPQFLNVLFSFHKGFFVYAPTMFVALIGVYYFLKKESKYFFFGWLISFFVWLYAISSWWCWDYGGGLGMRAMIEMLPLLMFPMMYLFKIANRIVLLLSGMVLVGGIYFYQLFQFQFNRDIIHYNEMDYKYFKYVFLKTDDRYRWMIDFDLMREHLPEGQKEVAWNIQMLEGSKWGELKNFDSSRFEITSWDNQEILNYFPKENEHLFLGRLTGEIKLNNPNCNPSLSVRYFNNENKIEETTSTIGSNIDDPSKFQKINLEINHDLKFKNCTRIEIFYSNGGCQSDFRNVKFEKYMPN